MNNRSGFLSNVPPVVRGLILINALVLLLTYVTGNFMYEHFALYFPESPMFKPHQLLTHMFMHGGLAHLFFNMYALWLFGCALEYQWGSKKFLVFYLVTGIGAAAFYLLTVWLQVLHLESAIAPEMLVNMKQVLSEGMIYTKGSQEAMDWFQIMHTPMVGASGAVYGVLLGFGMLFPNVELRFIFPPVTLKAKWVVVIYGAIELFLGVSNSGGNVAHFAHIGGMIFAFILIKYWQKKGQLYN